MATSPFRSQLETALQAARAAAPAAVSQALPVLEQLEPVFLDVSNGRQEFTPSPNETDDLVRTYYNVARNLLVQFESDAIDETPRLAKLLRGDAAISGAAAVELRAMPGDHTRCMSADAVEVPPDVARMANEAVKGSKDFLGAHHRPTHSGRFGCLCCAHVRRCMERSTSSLQCMAGVRADPLTTAVLALLCLCT